MTDDGDGAPSPGPPGAAGPPESPPAKSGPADEITALHARAMAAARAAHDPRPDRVAAGRRRLVAETTGACRDSLTSRLLEQFDAEYHRSRPPGSRLAP